MRQRVTWRNNLGSASGEYVGPVASTRLKVGGRELVVIRPGDPDRLLDADKVRERNAQEDYMPYWAYLWPGAYLLADAVAKEVWPTGTRALEIGCGLGLAGLMGLATGLRVRFTDYDAAALGFVQRSASENGFGEERYSTGLLDWRDRIDDRWPVILGADVLYERRLVPLVAHLIEQSLEPSGLALIAGPYRVATEDFPSALNSRGLVFESRSVETQDERGALVRGTLYRIRKNA